MSTTPQTAIQKVETSPLITELASGWKINPVTMINTLKATIFPQSDRGGKPVVVSNEQIVAFLQVCSAYALNPFVKEIYAFPTKGGGIVPMVPVDGWAKIINRNEHMDGVEFIDDWEVVDGKKALISTTCIIHRKDRKYPTKITEYLSECYQPSKEPWVRWPARMLRHKSLIQCARVAFALAGIYDPDEAERIAESEEAKKDVITRPSREIEGTVAKASASSASMSAEPQAEAAKVEGAKPSPQAASCLCECCKDLKCSCPSKDDFDQCGCPACAKTIADAKKPKAEAKQEPKAETPTVNQPTGQELFPADGQTFHPAESSKPGGPYVEVPKLKKLMAVARAAGIQITKDSHDDALHKLLKEKYGIESMREIPVNLFDEILQLAGGDKMKVR